KLFSIVLPFTFLNALNKSAESVLPPKKRSVINPTMNGAGPSPVIHMRIFMMERAAARRVEVITIWTISVSSGMIPADSRVPSEVRAMAEIISLSIRRRNPKTKGELRVQQRAEEEVGIV
ncbi:hypothetical protein PMAYCL1PPCAC_28280, partial [Pristionchus mayeri]